MDHAITMVVLGSLSALGVCAAIYGVLWLLAVFASGTSR